MDSLAALRAWQADVALVDDLTIPPNAAEPNIERIPILDDLLYAVLPNAHPLAARAKIAIADLRNERWAISGPSRIPGRRRMWRSSSAGPTPRR